VAGDVTRAHLGLHRATHAQLVRETSHILHGAASVRFDMPLASTAFVSGSHPGWFAEDDLDIGQQFPNSHQQSKVEAELGLQRRVLAAGTRATSTGAIGDMAARAFATKPPRFESTALERKVVPTLARLLSFSPWIRSGSALRQYLPYFERGSRFDTRCADALLRPRGIEPPPASEFLEPLLEFARSTNFGGDRAVIAARERSHRRRRERALRQRSLAGSHVP
jgi:hypothetical protein